MKLKGVAYLQLIRVCGISYEFRESVIVKCLGLELNETSWLHMEKRVLFFAGFLMELGTFVTKVQLMIDIL